MKCEDDLIVQATFCQHITGGFLKATHQCECETVGKCPLRSNQLSAEAMDRLRKHPTIAAEIERKKEEFRILSEAAEKEEAERQARIRAKNLRDHKELLAPPKSVDDRGMTESQKQAMMQKIAKQKMEDIYLRDIHAGMIHANERSVPR